MRRILWFFRTFGLSDDETTALRIDMQLQRDWFRRLSHDRWEKP
ncbi:MAG TPA: hypothetical protein VMW38_25115 [Terriglobia bacterium]|nr:hypothetical protein [Terriglobia bacterium]